MDFLLVEDLGRVLAVRCVRVSPLASDRAGSADEVPRADLPRLRFAAFLRLSGGSPERIGLLYGDPPPELPTPTAGADGSAPEVLALRARVHLAERELARTRVLLDQARGTYAEDERPRAPGPGTASGCTDAHAGPAPLPAGSGAAAEAEAAAGDVSELTPREQEVALLVSEGLTNRMVAQRLGVSEWTVVNTLRKVMRKLDCSSRTQVANRVFRAPLAPSGAACG